MRQNKKTEVHHIHDNHNNMCAEIKTMLIKAVYNKYIFALHNDFTGYMGSSTKYIMNHLITIYLQIKAADI